MLYRKFLLTLLFLSFSIFASAEVFTVTNNADAGAGTLREALTKAADNGNGEKDYINFNLPDLSEAGRTIILITQLPDVSSNLVIDGSTQPGIKFGVSDAKVALFYQTTNLQALSGLRIVGQQDVELYGLYINNLTTVTTNKSSWRGVEIQNAKKIQIGDVGKGNVINGFYYPVVVNAPSNVFKTFENLTLKDNIFGFNADGETLSLNDVGPVSLYDVIGQTYIGGTPSEGNLFAQGVSFYQSNYNSYTSTSPIDVYSSTPASFLIKNNKIGVDYAERTSILTSDGIRIATIYPGGKNTYNIEDNVIVGKKSYAIYVGNNGSQVNIVRNYIGIDKTLQNILPSSNVGIFITWSDLVSIGSNNSSDANYITGCKPVFVWDYATASINKNSFFCTVNASPMIQNFSTRPVTKVNILSIKLNSVSGTATPNSSIELFYSDKCNTCSPQTYFGSTTSDANGVWQYNGLINGSVIASATFNKSTSEFTQTSIDVSNVKITNACNNTGGSIKGAIPQSAVNVQWIDESGNIVSTDVDLVNIKPGKYKLQALNGNCNAFSSYFQVINAITVDPANISTGNPSCNSSNGYIKGIKVIDNSQGQLFYSWKDSKGLEQAKTLDLQNANAGVYILTITNADKSCTQTYGPITLKNTTGPNIDETTVKKTSTPCGLSQGSITNLNITGTGNLKYSWKNAQNQEVSTTKDLTNQHAGKYILQVTDETTCGPVYSSTFEINEINGVTIDDTQKQITIATCTDNNGSITGIKAAGATSYQWINSSGKVISTSLDLTGAAPDNYYLLASNSASCSKQSPTYTITRQANLINIGGTSKILKDASCGQNNGRIEVLLQNPVILPKYYRWQNSNGQTMGSNSLILNNIDAGTYSLYGTDDNGCEKLIIRYAISRIPELQIVSGSAQIFNDQCTQKIGNIKGVKIAGGVPPYSYKWVNAAGQQFSAIADLLNVQGGTYQLQVKDATDCGTVSQTFTLTDQAAVVAAPSANNLQLCGPGKSFLTVNNPVPGSTYRLYNTLAGTTPVDEQPTGKFQVSVKSNSKFYISQVIGSCESTRTEVNISVGISAVNIANTFSPNGDGINDLWLLKGIENYPAALVQLFNRYGQKVFESKGYVSAFDGNINSKRLPEGTYYYIINLSSACNLISGNLTLIR